MDETLRAYPGLVRASMQVALTYRGLLVVRLLGALFPMLLLFVWLTVVADATTPSGWDAGRLVSYYVAAGVVFQLTSSHISWIWDADLRSGELSARLLRPVPVFHQYAALEAGYVVVNFAILVPVAVVLTATMSLVAYDFTAVVVVETTAALVVAFVIGVLMSSTFALIGFWTTQSGNLYLLWWGIGSFASGWVAPLDLMPDWLRRIAWGLPFRYGLGFPVELLLGRLDGGAVVIGFAVALAWTSVFAGLYIVTWRRGVRRYQAVGG